MPTWLHITFLKEVRENTWWNRELSSLKMEQSSLTLLKELEIRKLYKDAERLSRQNRISPMWWGGHATTGGPPFRSV